MNCKFAGKAESSSLNLRKSDDWEHEHECRKKSSKNEPGCTPTLRDLKSKRKVQKTLRKNTAVGKKMFVFLTIFKFFIKETLSSHL